LRFYAEHKLGGMLKETPKNPGAAVTGIGKRGSLAEPRCDSPPTLVELGIDKKLSSRAQAIAELSIETIDDVDRRDPSTEHLHANLKPVTVRALISELGALSQDLKGFVVCDHKNPIIKPDFVSDNRPALVLKDSAKERKQPSAIGFVLAQFSPNLDPQRVQVNVKFVRKPKALDQGGEDRLR
jgi:hypothetical protein